MNETLDAHEHKEIMISASQLKVTKTLYRFQSLFFCRCHSYLHNFNLLTAALSPLLRTFFNGEHGSLLSFLLDGILT